jgi:pimeloyl-ACP methyl ester carboxylesterase
MPILGQTLYERRTLDLLTAIQVVRAETNVGHVVVFGKGYDAAIAVYAALLDPTITELVLQDPVATHWNGGPEFLNVLRTGDLPHNLALAFPRPITFIGKIPEAYAWTKACYAVCGMAERVRTVETLGAWRPTVAKTGAAAGRKTAEGPAVVA